MLIITPFFSPNIGGVETHLDDLCEFLNKAGYAVHVITYQPLMSKAWAPPFEQRDRITIRRVQWIRNLLNKVEKYPSLEFFYLFPGLFTVSLFHLLNKRNTVDVIHAHGLAAATIAYLLYKIFKKKYVVSIHWVVGLRNNGLLARVIAPVLNNAQTVLTISDASKNDLLHGCLSTNKVKTSRYWVDLQRFKPIDKKEARKLLGWENDVFYILFVGRLIEAKGVRICIQIAKELQSDSNVQLIVVGDGPLRKEVEQASRIIRTLRFIGPVENKMLPTFYSAADIVIVPSLHEEAYGRVIMESLSCGTPVIASNRGGIPELVNDSVGLIVEPIPQEFLGKIKHLMKHRVELLRLANNCRRYAEETFSEKNASLILNSYLECCVR